MQNIQYSIFIITILLSTICNCQHLIIPGPSNLTHQLNGNKISIKLSPIGFRPKFGVLHGRLMLATPLSACQDILSVDEENEDIFILADDIQCMQSIKVQNIANAGAFAAILRDNPNTTLHDKEINAVHIPIMELSHQNFDILAKYVRQNGAGLSALADFNIQENESKKKISMQIWLSPAQLKSYQFITKFSSFILNQQEFINFQPRYVFQSHTTSPSGNKQYIGCLSGGRFCPPELEYQGRPEGAKIVSQALRQIILAKNNLASWFRYMEYYSVYCLPKGAELWTSQNSELCSQSAMLTLDINPLQISQQYNKSFQGPKPQTSPNTYLQQQRQLLAQQNISSYPILLLNHKQYQLQNPQGLKIRICNMMSPLAQQHSKQCRKLTDPDIFSWTQIIYALMLVAVAVIVFMVFFKRVIKNRMRGELRQNVNNTLRQYYQFMDNFQQNGNQPNMYNQNLHSNFQDKNSIDDVVVSSSQSKKGEQNGDGQGKNGHKMSNEQQIQI